MDQQLRCVLGVGGLVGPIRRIEVQLGHRPGNHEDEAQNKDDDV